MYSTRNEGKSVVAERFIRTSKDKVYKYMTSVLKNVYIHKLHDFMKKNCIKQIKKESRIEKVIKRKGDKLYVK